MKQCISSDEAVQSDIQHTNPCSDCPWSRQSLPGWIGANTIGDWLSEAKGDNPTQCHVIDNQQCAGIAIFRRNICKMPRKPALILERDTEKVFANGSEFANHHWNFGK